MNRPVDERPAGTRDGTHPQTPPRDAAEVHVNPTGTDRTRGARATRKLNLISVAPEPPRYASWPDTQRAVARARRHHGPDDHAIAWAHEPIQPFLPLRGFGQHGKSERGERHGGPSS